MGSSYPPPYANGEQPGQGVAESENNSSTYSQQPRRPAKMLQSYRQRYRIIIIILIIIVIGAVIGGAVGGTKAASEQQRDASGATVTSSSTSVPVTLPPSPSVITSVISITSVVTTASPSPTPSNCAWVGSAPFCWDSCPFDTIQTQEDNCGNGNCCIFGYKVYCCQE